MRYSWIPILVIGFAAGFVSQPIVMPLLRELFGLPPSRFPASKRELWRAVDYYNEYVNNPKNHHQGGVKPPYELEPILESLVGADELKCEDLVFPEVVEHGPAFGYLLKWSNKNKDIIYWIQEHGGPDYKTSGKQPLHFRIWFRESAKPAVQQMIKDVEALAKTESKSSNR
ncbi:hypothetical protein K2Y11_11830 [bacterium]|nr:hypothetical protein [bacterium]